MSQAAIQLSDAQLHRMATEYVAKNGGTYSSALQAVIESERQQSGEPSTKAGSDSKSQEQLLDSRARSFAQTHGVSYAEALNSIDPVRSGASFSEAPTARMEILTAGPRTAKNGREENFSQADLQAMARAYDRRLHEAPLVLGPAEDTAPAAGWVARLEVQGDALVAHLTQLDPAMASLVKGDAKSGRVVVFYSPADTSNPVPGAWYLRSISWPNATALNKLR